MYRLLIADDEMIERKVLCKTLTQNLGDQCEILQAENGRQVLEMYEQEKPHILILDIEMPGITGIEAAQIIRRTDKDCCIIFLTAFDEFSYAKKAITVKALDYLLKPYDEQELLLVVEEAMRLVKEQMKGRIKASVMQETKREVISIDEENEELSNTRLTKVSQIILKFIEENYAKDISMQDLAMNMNYSEAYFCKLFKQCFSKNFTTYLTEYRITEAKKLLEQPMVNIKDVGIAVGYTDSNYFTKVFKRITGQIPTEYRMCIFQREQETSER